MFFLDKPLIFIPKTIGEVLFMGAAYSSTTAFKSRTAIKILKKATRGIPIRITVEGYKGRIYIDLRDCRLTGFHGGTHESPKYATLKYSYKLNKKRSVYYVSNY